MIPTDLMEPEKPCTKVVKNRSAPPASPQRPHPAHRNGRRPVRWTSRLRIFLVPGPRGRILDLERGHELAIHITRRVIRAQSEPRPNGGFPREGPWGVEGVVQDAPPFDCSNKRACVSVTSIPNVETHKASPANLPGIEMV
jgi:hypothetical protein